MNIIETHEWLVTYTSSVTAPHDITDEDKLAALVASMEENGWIGAPLVVDGEQALTGSHRSEAARLTGTRIPVIQIAELMGEYDQDWVALVEGYGVCDLMDIGTLVHRHLPADVCAAYGIDLC